MSTIPVEGLSLNFTKNNNNNNNNNKKSQKTSSRELALSTSPLEDEVQTGFDTVNFFR